MRSLVRTIEDRLMDINPLLEDRRVAIAALIDIATQEGFDEANDFHYCRNTAQDTLKALGVPYGEQPPSIPAQPAPIMAGNHCIHGRKLYNCCMQCGRKGEPHDTKT